MKKFLTLILAALFLTSCGAKQEKILVLFYSQSNTTKTVAQEIQKQLGCDIEEIECVEPYTGNFGDVAGRWQKEMQEGKTVEIKPLTKNVKDYDVIFLGFPIWGGVYASPVATFVKNTDFSGKKLVPFCTFGSGGLNTGTAELKKNIKNATFIDGYGIRQARISNVKEEVEQFLIKAGFKQGTLEQLSDFSAQKEVTDKEKDIFHKACDNYQFPLGNPVTCGSRERKDGVEYLYNVENQDGKQTKIYVIVKNGATPEFTEVVR
ncbi:MAG: hypothetical protein II956_01910 [Bacteroidales bacterium]|nr:hypothetical protein [Bacteroidales bacterium]